MCSANLFRRDIRKFIRFGVESLERRLPLSVTFVDSGQTIGVAAESDLNPYSVGAGLNDLDGDGDIDIFITSGNGYQVWLNDGRGQFMESGQQLKSEVIGSPILADVDGDGDTDAITAAQDFSGGLTWLGAWINDGSASFTLQRTMVATGPFTAGPGLGDFDGDLDVDVFLPLHAASPRGIEVWLNNGDARFEKGDQQFDRQDGGLDAAVGDLDGDGDLDVFLAGADRGRHLWLNDGNGQFR